MSAVHDFLTTHLMCLLTFHPYIQGSGSGCCVFHYSVKSFTCCDLFSPLLLRIIKDKEAMKEDYQKSLELFFSYGYGCCVFKHNICGDYLEVPNCMPDSTNPLFPGFFASPRCPPLWASSSFTIAKVNHEEAREEPERSAPAGDLNGTS